MSDRPQLPPRKHIYDVMMARSRELTKAPPPNADPHPLCSDLHNCPCAEAAREEIYNDPTIVWGDE